MTTQRILECTFLGGISSVSAMVFMEDSERAAEIAQERQIDAGLHLNLTAPFSRACIPARLFEYQRRLSCYLGDHRFSSVVFHPALGGLFEYVVRMQLDEFTRLYTSTPQRIDGHHHMHLCSNVLLAKLLPPGCVVRRNFTFAPGEKSWVNRCYRSLVDGFLSTRYRLTNYFFSLTPLEPARLGRIFSLARKWVVEVETHPANPSEYRFLTNGELFRRTGEVPIARSFTVARA